MATLSDIAKQAGVSIPTVSRVLNPYNSSKAASSSTEVLVRKIAKELDYSPNALARGLSTQRTYNIGILWDKRMDSPEEAVFWSPVLRGLMSGCKAMGYECMVSVENYQKHKGFQLPRGFRERYVDGLIVTYPLGDTNKQVQKKLISSGIPFVVIWSTFGDERIWTVDIDPNPGFRQALLHLYELGHRNIGYCVYPHWQVGEYHASKALEQEIEREFDIRLQPLEVDLTESSHAEEGQRLGEAIASRSVNITAMVMGDIICTEAIKYLAQKGICIYVPRDFSVVALADSIVCRCCNPQLTTIVQPLNQLGEQAVALLVDSIKARFLGVSLTPRHVKLPQGFIVRDSTGPVPKWQ